MGAGNISQKCVFLLLQYLLQSCSRGGRGIVEDVCYERRQVPSVTSCSKYIRPLTFVNICQYSPRTRSVDVLTIPSPTSASKPGRTARGDTRDIIRFSDNMVDVATQHGKTPRQQDTQLDESEVIEFGSTAHHCGSFDPRVPPPMLGRVQPLVTWQVRRRGCMPQYVLCVPCTMPENLTLAPTHCSTSRRSYQRRRSTVPNP